MKTTDHQTDLHNKDATLSKVSNDIMNYLSTFEDMNDGLFQLSTLLEKKPITIKRWIQKKHEPPKSSYIKLYSAMFDIKTVKDLFRVMPKSAAEYIKEHMHEDEIKRSILIKSNSFDKNGFLKIFNEVKQNAEIFSMALKDNYISMYELTMEYGKYGIIIADRYVESGAFIKNTELSRYELSEEIQSDAKFEQSIAQFIQEKFNIDDTEIEFNSYISSYMGGVTEEGYKQLIKHWELAFKKAQMIAKVYEGNHTVAAMNTTVIDVFGDMKKEDPTSKNGLIQ